MAKNQVAAALGCGMRLAAVPAAASVPIVAAVNDDDEQESEVSDE